jgi:hypothetical protein
MKELLGICAGIWVLSLAAALLGFRWSLWRRQRFLAATVASVFSIALSYVGLTRFTLSASKTVNGSVTWSFNSKYFFYVSLTLGAAALVCSLWRIWRREGVQLTPPVIPAQ